VAWWFPYFLLFDAFILVGVILFIWRRRSRNADPEGEESEMSNKIDAELDEMLEGEVRKLRDG
jgi:hypothetical protein